MREEQNLGKEPAKEGESGSITGLSLRVVDIRSPLLVGIIERRKEEVVVENMRGERVTIHLSVFADNHMDAEEDELLLPEGLFRNSFGEPALRLAAAREKEDLALLREHFSFLFSYRDRITQSGYLSACYSPAWRIGGIPVGGGDYLSLGVLLRLWSAGRLLMECPDCSKSGYIYYLVGSYLSGRNSAHGYCPSCKRFVCRSALAGRSLGRFRGAIKEVSRELYLGGGGRHPRLYYPQDLQPPERGCPSLRMVIEELAAY